MSYKNIFGQTASELAILGTVLMFVMGILVRYGISLNFLQDMKFDTFRQAIDVSQFQNSEWYKGGDWHRSTNRRQASLLYIDVKPALDVADPFGSSDFLPYFGTASAVWSRDLYGTMVWGDDDHLPVIDMRFKNNFTFKHYAFTTAGYNSCRCDGGSPECVFPLKIKISQGNDLFEDGHGYTEGDNPGTYWKWYDINSCDDVNPEDGDNSSVDVDDDDKLEIVLSTDGHTEQVDPNCDPYDPETPPCETFYVVDALKYLDYQEGEIDFTMDSQDIFNDPNLRQGLMSEYRKRRVPLGSLESMSAFMEKEETLASIRTESQLNTQVVFQRVIRLNGIPECSGGGGWGCGIISQMYNYNSEGVADCFFDGNFDPDVWQCSTTGDTNEILVQHTALEMQETVWTTPH